MHAFQPSMIVSFTVFFHIVVCFQGLCVCCNRPYP
jgi:hypothetical protein